MTEEQIKQKAEEYRKNFNYYQDWQGQVIDKSTSTIVEQAFIDGYHECQKEHAKYKEMCEDMKADMCGTDNKTLCDYLIKILKKYGEIV